MSEGQFPVPILFLIFNRPDTTRVVFQKIKELRPTRLYIAADGPRTHVTTDIQNCFNTRAVTKEIDWSCDVSMLFRENNLGCKLAVSSAIDWFFRHEPEGIILEDDCLPNSDFFGFCRNLLERYRDDERVMHIGGTNFQFGVNRGDGDYYFSKIAHIWGWASWRRAWQKYDRDLSTLDFFLHNKLIESISEDITIQNYWKRAFKLTRERNNTWDFQWSYTCLVNNGLAVIPQKNLVINIGFGDRATHGAFVPRKIRQMQLHPLESIKAPTFFIPDKAADYYTLKQVFEVTTAKRIINRMKKILRNIK